MEYTSEMINDDIDILEHYGTPQPYAGAPTGSGRYRKGSGEVPFQHGADFLQTVENLKREGLSETEIARALDISTTELRAKKSIAKAEKRSIDAARALELKDKGYSNAKIAEMMGLPGESSVRNLLNPALAERNDKTSNTADVLKKAVSEKGFIDIGAGVEREMGVSDTRLKTAVAMLREEGYEVYYVKVPQATIPGQYTTVKVLAPPGTKYTDVSQHKGDIKSITDYSVDDGKTFYGIEYPASLDSKRVMIRYAEEGGTDLDGVIQLRRNVEDISLGDSSYAQVRIMVDGTHYLKGMAMYTDDLPDGIDIIYNTNKHQGTPKEKVFKELKKDSNGEIDKDNPFGAVIKSGPGGQRHYIDENGEEKLSVINKIKDEGDWNDYSRSLSSQMLSKQSMTLINRQLNLAYADKLAEYDEINSLTNPAVKKKLLESFADDCDASAVHLKAAALPRQSTQVILPIPALKDDEIYAPNYHDGEKVALIRYPHGGTFEIPVLTVNNKHPQAKDILGNATDAVGINSKVAERLSGADFDGDTALVIPTSGNGRNASVKITSTRPLPGLDGFNPKEAYPGYPGMKVISPTLKQTEMGKVSNLITDMTLKGATDEELARAVRHSMVVIDAEKHELNYKQSYIDNGIAELKQKYQGGTNKGASTLISKASSVAYVNEREEGKYITDPETGKRSKRYFDPNTGEKLYTDTERTYINKSGKEVVAKQKSTKMAETNDARSLSSGTLQEEAYAAYANNLKDLANKARLDTMDIPKVERSSTARITYKEQVDSLNAKLDLALRNAPKERQAQIIANEVVSAKKKDNPDMSDEAIQKAKNQALAAARVRVGASGKDSRITITDSEWEAIQAGAISDNALTKILNHADMDDVRQKALPKTTTELSEAKQNKIKAMKSSGYTTSEIADALGVSTTTIHKYTK